MFSTFEKQDVNIYNSVLIERWTEQCFPRVCFYVWICVGLDRNKIELTWKIKWNIKWLSIQSNSKDTVG